MCSLQLHHVIHSSCRDTQVHGPRVQMKSLWPQQGCRVCLATHYPSVPQSMSAIQVGWCVPFYKYKRLWTPSGSHRRSISVQASSIPLPSKAVVDSVTKFAACSSASVLKIIRESHLFRQCAPAVGLMVFATWGLGPLLRIIHRTVLHKEDRAWKESQMNHIMRMYVRPVLLWVGVILICRAVDPIMLSSEASQAIKQRLINFVRSLSTVLAFAYCTTSLVQQLHKVMLDKQDSQNSRSLGAQFVGNAVYTAVWIAAVCLFMELLGFSTQKWLTAGGLGTVLITLAGREIFTNFLSSIMIHATRPFVLNEWIQTKIDGYEVSGTVEHVGWWSPTIVRGDDREAVHIPNHKFTVSVVRNLSQKSHWRIKTYFGISHLDVTKVPSIVADMRKVLAKHPQVEQRRLHRRVFFESINPENQALMILVSCFVKTPHFEEYLRVKEVILLDLLKVISHHHARLATPIRSVQRVLDDIEPRGNPFRDMSRASEARPYLLIEASTIASQHQEAEQPSNTKNISSPPKEDLAVNDADKTVEKSSEQTGNARNGALQTKDDAIGSDGSPWTVEPVTSDVKSVNKHKPQLEGLDSMGLNSKDITLLGAAFEKPPANIPEGPVEPAQVEKVPPKIESGTTAEKTQSKVMEQQHSGQSQKSHTQSTTKKQEKSVAKGSTDQDSHSVREDKSKKNEMDRKPQTHPVLDKGEIKTDAQPSQKTDASSRMDTKRTQKSEIGGSSAGTKNQLEENLVLGVALNGPKQTLPLDDNTTPATEQKELVGSSNGNSSSTGKDTRKGSQPNAGPLESR